MEKLETLNKLLKVAYKFGYEAGYSWYDRQKVCGISGHLLNEETYYKEATELAKELAPCLGLGAEEILVYMLEDTGYHSDDWDYIAPEIAKKEGI